MKVREFEYGTLVDLDGDPVPIEVLEALKLITVPDRELTLMVGNSKPYKVLPPEYTCQLCHMPIDAQQAMDVGNCSTCQSRLDSGVKF